MALLSRSQLSLSCSHRELPLLARPVPQPARRCARSLAPSAASARVVPLAVASSFVQSVDPLAASTKPFAFGSIKTIHSQEELDALMAEHKDRLTVLMCKSSHCRPCKAFARSYMALAQRFANSVLLDITGDESPECRKLMKDWGVKVTPTFRIFRNGQLLDVCTGVKNEGEAITTHILKHLGPEDAGRDWVAPVDGDNSDDE